MSFKSRLLNVLFWSVISAAFIGPGTLATASAAGAAYKFQLIWALAFATLACIVLQEMAARLTIASGMEIAEAIKKSPAFLWLGYFIGLGVIFGCAAYEAGNILGALAGIELLFNINRTVLTVIIGLVCALLLWWGNAKAIANLLGTLVALMGIAFVYVALQVEVDPAEIAQGFVPYVPEGAEWLVLGLIGTTIVPYNLFLGSGISKGQLVKDMRFGLIISGILGGIVSIAILVTATKINTAISFQQIAIVMGDSIGQHATAMLALGLFAAGFTSSITAPLAAGIVARSLSASKSNRVFRFTWGIVLLTGLIFGVAEIQPIPVIIAAQAFNGMILPLVAMLLIILTNNIRLVGPEHLNSQWFNVLSLLILNVVLLIGLNNVFKAVAKALDFTINNDLTWLFYMELLALPFIIFTAYKIIKLRKG